MRINKAILATLLSVSLLLQMVIITYNHLTGYNTIGTFLELLVGLSFGTAFSFLTAILLTWLDIRLINYLNRSLPWGDKSAFRILSDLFGSAIPGAITGILLTLLVNTITPYDEALRGVIISNALITSVVNILIMVSLEGYWFFTRERIWLERANYLEQENNSIRYEVLKNQLNPHFLFNSLNVLSSLVDRKNSNAQDFIDEFAMIYRYILESIDKKLVPVTEEIAFCKSYLYLQEARFNNGFSTEIMIDAAIMEQFIPPLSVQLLLENIFKHNVISPEAPVTIVISGEDGFVVVKNSLKLKNRPEKGTGIGLRNLSRRYALISDKKPVFTFTNDYYIAKIPLIEII